LTKNGVQNLGQEKLPQTAFVYKLVLQSGG